MLPTPGHSVPSVLFDVVAAGCVVLLAVFDPQRTEFGSWLLPIGTSIGTAVVLLWRRYRPNLVFYAVVAITGTPIMILLIGGDRSRFPLVTQATEAAVLMALYAVVKYGRRSWDGWLAVALTLAGTAVVVLAIGGGWPEVGMMGCTAIGACALVWLLAAYGRTRLRMMVALRERAVAAERERDHRARLAVAEERASIARELHDLAAHSLLVMVVQADGARALLDRDPQRVRSALETVSSTGRDALDEMRRLVAILRGNGATGNSATGSGSDGSDDERDGSGTGAGDAGGSGDDGAAGWSSHAASGRLDGLVERASAAGVAVEVVVSGQPPPMPPGVELAVYRVAQEAITNSIKHAGAGTHVTLRLGYEPGIIEVRVSDDGAGRSALGPRVAPSGGHGLIGLRERVALYDGTFSAGPHREGGWLVHARIPVDVNRSGSLGTSTIAKALRVVRGSN